MYRNFLRVGSATIDLDLLNIENNKNEIMKTLDLAHDLGLDLLVFPELSLSGASGGDLIANQSILDLALESLMEIKNHSLNKKILFSLGLPLEVNNRIYNVLALINDGKILGFIPKINLSPVENRYFATFDQDMEVLIGGINYLISPNILVKVRENSKIIGSFSFEDDLNQGFNLASVHASLGANLLMVSGSSAETSLSLDRRKKLLSSLSSSYEAGLIFANSSQGESTTNHIYGGHKGIWEAGTSLEDSGLFRDGLIYNDINLDQIKNKKTSRLFYQPKIYTSYASLSERELPLKRRLAKSPYIPENQKDWEEKCEKILNLQSEALKRRLEQIPDKKIFLGLSGGLDSTLALLVASITYFKMGLDPKDIRAITMPGLGTTQRTFTNSINLAKSLNVSLEEISIVEATKQHFKDIGHDEDDLSITYENSQARERTQILMDLANKHGGIVLGTGNMSEIALGWATYNGDHMSMYAINSGLPKTLLREVVKYVALNSQETNPLLASTIFDIINTPISPELLPAEDGEIKQITEDNVGPYELHDFFIYHLINNKSSLDNINFMAKEAFKDDYSSEEIDKWFNKFLWRFKTQQFKRSAMPDGPQIEEFSLSPRDGLVMASDISINSFTKK